MRITKAFLQSLLQPVIGIDEVGRGCLAGPVYAAAVIFKSEKDVTKYYDSKIIEHEEREKLASSVLEHHHAEVGIASVEEVDRFNIREATFLAMRRAVEQLAVKHKITTGTLLVDGRDKIPDFESFQQLAIVDGDDKVRVISAASLVAKVARDRFMTDLSQTVSHYGFEQHKGYGTKYHREQIQKHGPSIWHRQTFSGVKEYLQN